MPRFDVYRNPNARASHALFVEVQCNLVSTATRWCVPLRAAVSGQPVMQRAQSTLTVLGQAMVLDTPNLLAVPRAVLREPVARLSDSEQALVESCIDFMLRGWRSCVLHAHLTFPGPTFGSRSMDCCANPENGG